MQAANVTTLIAYVIALAVPIAAVLLIRALDFFKTTNFTTLLLCMLWGGVGAFGLAYLLNNAMLRLLTSTGLGGYETVVGFSAPIVEEVLKALILIYLVRQPSFRYLVDGAIYGFGVGIGFAVIENFFYIANASGAALPLAITRVLSTSLMHALASGIVGISLGRLRRSNRQIPATAIIGIVVAIAAHILYNNIVNVLDGAILLLVAIVYGVGGAALIAWQINLGLGEEKASFGETLDVARSDVSQGEVKAIQRLGATSVEQLFGNLERELGMENVALVRKLLITQANIGILRNNLQSRNVSNRLRQAWEAEIAERQTEFQDIRRVLNRSVMTYFQQQFPSEDAEMWNWLTDEMIQNDPTMVHTFDAFMRTSGLAETFTPEQLEAMAERLHAIEIFRDVALSDLENLGRAIQVEQFKDGEVLFQQGDAGDAMYLIEAGEIAIFTMRGGETHTLRVFGAGHVVGDFAVLDGQPRSASARANGALTALVLQRQMFSMFIQSRPQMIAAVLKALAEKARYTTATLEESVRAVGQIAQGNYAAVTQKTVTGNVPAASSTAEISEGVVEKTEVSGQVHRALTRALARFAGALEKREGELRASGASHISSASPSGASSK